ncbi:hypothetical protein AMR41_08265 [Hapalosiphon sp. MRB220]|nr:hypothetical protein AMR41_08265 [Hapalosiphon sp. MRB220]
MQWFTIVDGLSTYWAVMPLFFSHFEIETMLGKLGFTEFGDSIFSELTRNPFQFAEGDKEKLDFLKWALKTCQFSWLKNGVNHD